MTNHDAPSRDELNRRLAGLIARLAEDYPGTPLDTVIAIVQDAQGSLALFSLDEPDGSLSLVEAVARQHLEARTQAAPG